MPFASPRPAWALVVVGALLLAGCAGKTPEVEQPPDHGVQTSKETHDSRITSDQRRVYNFSLAADGALTYDLFVRNGKMSITIMNRSEAPHFMEGLKVRKHYESQSAHEWMETVPLPVGSYAVGLRCNNLREDCPYLLTLTTYERRGPGYDGSNETGTPTS